MRKVFISYVREDAAQIDRLVAHLESNHIGVWLDRRDLIPGERWKSAIRRAIKNGAFFVACFSGNYTERKLTYMNEELLLAVEELRLRPRDQVWFIPIRLSRCTLPDLPIGPGGETLGDLHAIDLFRDWVAGCDRLVGAIKGFALEQRSWITRDLALNVHIKELYDYRCQVCGTRMAGPSGPYAEAARVRPFGKPHRGPDTADNTLCLCPNHHYLFDTGAFGVRDDLRLIGMEGRLRVDPRHPLSVEHLRYHREHFGLAAGR